MKLRVIGAVMVLLGLVVAGSGVASATLWRPADHVHAEAIASGATTLLVTDPGVLELVDDTVQVRASGPRESTVVLVIGREPDVRAWVGLDPHTRVTGLADVATLAAEPGQPLAPPVVTPPPGPEDEATPDDDAASDDDATDEATPDDDAASDDEATSDDAADEETTSDVATTDDATGDDDGATGDGTDEAGGAAPDPSGSDMWVVEVSGDEAAELEWTRTPGRWSLLVASTGPNAGQPTLELTWPQEVRTPWFWPGIWLGVAIAVIGLGLIALAWRRGRGADEWTEVAEPVPAVEVPAGPLTRRQLRELEAAQAAGRSRRRQRETTVTAAQSSETAPVRGAERPAASPTASSAAHASDHGRAQDAPATADAPTSPAPTDGQAPRGPEPFVPTFEPRRPGGIVPHVPAMPPAQAGTHAARDAAATPPDRRAPGQSSPGQAGPPSAAWPATSSEPTQPAPSWPAMPGSASQDPQTAFVPGPPTQQPPHGAPTESRTSTPGERPAAPAERRSRTGTFFQRRREAEASAPVVPTDPPQPSASAPETGAGHQAAAAPGGPAVPTSGAAPEEAAPRTASADAWRARWGFVEVPPSDPVPPEEPEDGGPR